MRKVLSVLFATICLYFSFNQIELDKVISLLLSANIQSILIALIITYTSFYLRSFRWKILVESPRKIKLKHYISTTHIGYFFNNIAPLRAGDLIRAKLLSNYTKTGFSFLFGSLVAEKIIDLWIIGLFSLVLILLGYFSMLGLEFSFLILILYIITSLIIFGNNSIINNFQSRFSKLENFVNGYKLLSKNKIQLFSLSICLWLCFIVYVFFVLQSIGISLSLEQYIGLTIISSLVTSLPFAPAAIGTYHLAVIYCLELYGIDIESAQSAAILMHTLFVLYTIISGYIYLSLENLNFKTIINESKN